MDKQGNGSQGSGEWQQDGLPPWKRVLDLTLICLASPALLLVGEVTRTDAVENATAFSAGAQAVEDEMVR